jgi:voltage-gated potassium channel
MTVLGGGAAFAAVEPEQQLSTWDGVWWAIVTVTTVGYGDLAPQTDAGRLIAIAVMLIGIGLIAVLTAAAAERFLRAQRNSSNSNDREVVERLRRLEERIDALQRRTP